MTHLLNALAQATGVELAPAASRTSTLTGTGIDVLEYEGVALVLLNASAGTGTSPTLDVKLQHSDDDSTYEDVTSGTFSQVTDAAETAGVKVMKLNVSDLKRYLRIVGTIAGTTPSFDFGVEFVGITKAG
ncbi:MAG TPA: hypothetical protein PLH84_08485 [Candidatus Krumholzibacteria bacterium]|jgi:hypothetical protein|nr:hypothetical protein [Candidatus Krumholzibacteria bacterium]